MKQRPGRRWWQIGLSQILALMLLAAVLLGWWRDRQQLEGKILDFDAKVKVVQEELKASQIQTKVAQAQAKADAAALQALLEMQRLQQEKKIAELTAQIERLTAEGRVD